MSCDGSPTEGSVTWGFTFAEPLKENYPHIAEAVHMGLSQDPRLFLEALYDINVAKGFQAVCQAIEAFITHIVNTASAEKEDLLLQT
jgi:hypothetical protein